jgi:DNA replication and repair protein RecF
MQIDTIELRDFRNYEKLRLQLSPNLNVFTGENAQGKTNLLEAVYLCCLGKSHRTSHDAEMIRHGQPTAYAGVTVQRSDGPRHVEVLLSINNKKRISISGVSIARMSELMGHVQCILFSPEDLLLIKGGPSLRRRFLDASLCQLRPQYFLVLMRYNALVLQKNALLKQSKPDAALLDTYDSMLADSGAEIIGHRKSFIAQIIPLCARIHENISSGEKMDIVYKTQADTGAPIAEQLQSLYAQARSDELRRQRTSVGPHRDDLQLFINRTDARAFASQGQQRTIALSMKLACVEQMATETGQTPVLMLDDVFSELDEKRQKALIARISGQVLITTATTPPSLLKNGKRFLVSQGTVQPLP